MIWMIMRGPISFDEDPDPNHQRKDEQLIAMNIASTTTPTQKTRWLPISRIPQLKKKIAMNISKTKIRLANPLFPTLVIKPSIKTKLKQGKCLRIT